MAICDFPKTSSKIGQTSTSCLQKFTIHFRRPDTLKEKSNYSYRGEYGFDWLRDEYIYPIEKVDVDYISPINLVYLNKVVPLCKNPDDLREEYKRDIKNSITPYGIDYYPAWLSIFAYNVKGNAGSTMHKKGINLTLQLDEIDEIINDGTEIIFKPGKPCLKITPNRISISHFLKTPKKTRILDSDTGTPTINYYQLDSTINIKCFGDTLKEHEEVRVFAKLGTTEVEVGKLMVYQNDNIGKAKIVVVNVITEYDEKGNKIYPQAHKSFEYLYKYQSFNQAMIRTEVILGEELDLVKLSNVESNDDVRSFLNDIKNKTFMEDRYDAFTITERLCALYENYGKNRPEGGLVNEDGHFYTYLLFTTLSPLNGGLYGLASGKEKNWKFSSKLEYGNILSIFAKGLNDDHTLVHEAAHTFSLSHIFTDKYNKYVFHHGYTENYMDYAFFPTFNNSIEKKFNYINNKNQQVLSKKDNRYRGKMYSFYKWQWDLMREDRSIEKK
ncbi:hypothetical protein [Gilliamella apicola]|uniref:Uncharacterized protein n=1 Tax=Gilliamella apicola TaxID=1196095 RepID=A0A242NDZ1_9GAMM|nr:hypothetical protein [Gilliamella apicola]OTP81409.1 hypothetical protein B5S40_11640 [Gilliamella apicola]OTP83294.1 hypothetical protein B5S44_12545 [Gilliamella apicola]OTP90689.1 hypothetical protein B5S42_03420 [Gilliamella apicola]OTP97924.1 hypothetical protein B6D08_13035 [Gilliamella apicola]OTQ09353.1 hypothetical protein B6C91_09410 [Gilliamella apicola]